jgi:hypothetical protein
MSTFDHAVNRVFPAITYPDAHALATLLLASPGVAVSECVDVLARDIGRARALAALTLCQDAELTRPRARIKAGAGVRATDNLDGRDPAAPTARRTTIAPEPWRLVQIDTVAVAAEVTRGMHATDYPNVVTAVVVQDMCTLLVYAWLIGEESTIRASHAESVVAGVVDARPSARVLFEELFPRAAMIASGTTGHQSYSAVESVCGVIKRGVQRLDVRTLDRAAVSAAVRHSAHSANLRPRTAASCGIIEHAASQRLEYPREVIARHLALAREYVDPLLVPLDSRCEPTRDEPFAFAVTEGSFSTLDKRDKAVARVGARTPGFYWIYNA